MKKLFIKTTFVSIIFFGVWFFVITGLAALSQVTSGTPLSASTWNDMINSVNDLITNKANNNQVVKLTWDQIINWNKTFNNNVVVNWLVWKQFVQKDTWVINQRYDTIDLWGAWNRIISCQWYWWNGVIIFLVKHCVNFRSNIVWTWREVNLSPTDCWQGILQIRRTNLNNGWACSIINLKSW